MSTRGVARNAGMELPCRFLALGDSYTIGEGAPAEARWPEQLAARLRQDGVAIDSPTVLATTGWTTDELAAAMDRFAFAPPYALVTLLIGVNDQYRGRSADDYRPAYAALLARAIALAGGHPHRVVAVSIPDWGATPFARAQGRDPARIAADIDAFNAAAARIASDHGVAFVDVTGLSRKAGPDQTALVADGLHPSAAQYAAWTGVILPVTRAALRKG